MGNEASTCGGPEDLVPVTTYEDFVREMPLTTAVTAVQRNGAAKRGEKVADARKRSATDAGAAQLELEAPPTKTAKCTDFADLRDLFERRIKAEVYKRFNSDFGEMLPTFDHGMSYEQIWPEHIPGSKDAVPFSDVEKFLEPLLDYAKESAKLGGGGRPQFLMHEAITYCVSGKASHFVSFRTGEVKYNRQYDTTWRSRRGNQAAVKMRSRVDEMVGDLQRAIMQHAHNYSNAKQIKSVVSHAHNLDAHIKANDAKHTDAWRDLMKVLTPAQRDAFMTLQAAKNSRDSPPNPQGG